MGKRGPPKKPTKLRVLHGTHRKDRYGDASNEVQPAAFAGDPPVQLKGVSRDLWCAIVPRLMVLGLMTELDVPQLTIMCQAYEATQILNCDENNWYKAASVFDRIAKQFGMSASARQGMMTGDAKNDADELKFFGS